MRTPSPEQTSNGVPFTDPGSSIVRGLKAEGHYAGANRIRLQIPHSRATPRELRQRVPEGWRGARPSRRLATGRDVALYISDDNKAIIYRITYESQ
jgi:hypothetical protein